MSCASFRQNLGNYYLNLQSSLSLSSILYSTIIIYLPDFCHHLSFHICNIFLACTIRTLGVVLARDGVWSIDRPLSLFMTSYFLTSETRLFSSSAFFSSDKFL